MSVIHSVFGSFAFFVCFSFFLYYHSLQALSASSPILSFKMQYTSSLLALAATITTVHSHAAILAAVGEKGQSQGFLGKLHFVPRLSSIPLTPL